MRTKSKRVKKLEEDEIEKKIQFQKLIKIKIQKLKKMG